MSSEKQIDAILLDFSKAFDKVPHRRLLMKLDHYTRLSYRTYSTGATGLDLSPFLKIGTMLASLQSLGTVPSSSDVWNILVVLFCNDFRHVFNIAIMEK
jgi:hypothetical protein